MRRRSFITSSAATAAAVGAGVFSIIRSPREAKAAAWGAWPDDKLEGIIPEDLRVRRVLEVHFIGGITPWETFYCNPLFGGGDPLADNPYMYLFDNDMINGPEAFTQCGFGDPTMDYTEYFADDSNGQAIHLGPWTRPFRARPDIVERTRVMVQAHDNLAHEGANPIAFTGRSLGNPSMAGIGAHIQRYFLEQPGGQRAVPYSFLLFPTGAGFMPVYAQSATAIGFHPGSSRPMSVQVQPGSDLATLLQRPSVPIGNQREAFDAAVRYYSGVYDNRLRPGGVGARVRSTERGNHDFANFSRFNASELTSLLTDDLFQAIGGEACMDATLFNPAGASQDMSAMQAEIARQLLTHPDNPARYVQWIDTGVQPRPEVGHDVHNGHIEYSALNIPHTLERLASIIAAPGEDAEALGLLDLNDTLIVLNMEFGRTPYRQGTGTGTNHWPYGYVSVMIGGPVSATDSRSPGQSVYGWISETGADSREAGRGFPGYAQTRLKPTENRMLILAAMGIYPFTSQSFAVSDVQDVEDELQAAQALRDRLWGLNV